VVSGQCFNPVTPIFLLLFYLIEIAKIFILFEFSRGYKRNNSTGGMKSG